MIPLLRNDRTAARAISPRIFAGVMLFSWLAPFAFAIVLGIIATVLSVAGGGSAAEWVRTFALAFSIAPIGSWIGLIPGGIVFFLLLRCGVGGLLPVMVTGGLLGALIPAGIILSQHKTLETFHYFSKPELNLYTFAGIALSTLSWVALWLVSPTLRTVAPDAADRRADGGGSAA